MAKVPVRRDQLRHHLAAFMAWLNANGAEIGQPTNPYEVLRYRAYWRASRTAGTHIIYAKENGLLTWTGGSLGHFREFIDGDDCWFCGKPMPLDDMTIEHLIPQSDGGTNGLSNLALAHSGCNNAAGNKSLVEKIAMRAEMRAEKVSPQ